MKRIFQSMEWSRLCWDLSFSDKLELKKILPKVGSRYPIEIAWNEDFARKGFAEFLWRPPHSELNGWEERPSEICKSFVIGGELTDPSIEGKQFTFEVTSCVSLLDLLDSQKDEGSFNFPECGLPGGDSYILWERARNLHRSKVGKYEYISGTECETSLEAIVETTDSGTFLLFHAYLPPAHFDTIVTRKHLSGKELDVINQVMKNAPTLVDQTDIELEVGEIQGAKYY